jgi:acyl carrier protein
VDGRAHVDLRIAGADGTLALAIGDLVLQPMPVEDLARRPDTAAGPRGATGSLLELSDELGIHPNEGVLAFDRALRCGPPHVIVSSVDLDALAAAEAQPEQHAASGAPAGAGVVDLLRAVWSDLLGTSSIGLDDDFFELGGHSLIAIRLMARIHRELGVRLPLATLFEAPTIRQLTALIEPSVPRADLGAPTPAAAGETTPRAADAEPEPASLIVPMRPVGAGTPFFVVHGAGGNVLNLWGLAKQLPSDRPVMGILAKGCDNNAAPDTSIEQMAQR